jgi:hypothetical protein
MILLRNVLEGRTPLGTVGELLTGQPCERNVNPSKAARTAPAAKALKKQKPRTRNSSTGTYIPRIIQAIGAPTPSLDTTHPGVTTKKMFFAETCPKTDLFAKVPVKSYANQAVKQLAR